MWVCNIPSWVGLWSRRGVKENVMMLNVCFEMFGNKRGAFEGVPQNGREEGHGWKFSNKPTRGFMSTVCRG